MLRNRIASMCSSGDGVGEGGDAVDPFKSSLDSLWFHPIASAVRGSVTLGAHSPITELEDYHGVCQTEHMV
ncbi:hypothetical protein CgunFtcFv8_015429 [Champsocephalus gunnari]|uniref:Uncharacterized protein n=1 Tax=Champsocephalus gunnari TaxID=52237 RepID=A0AAN8C5X9_CHAGU|nr:hypothetical protein CgunFtcFv8_015429 [Champsocephalus gunnari]